MDSYVDLVCPGKRGDFQVISVSTLLAHLIQVILKAFVDVFSSTRITVKSCRLPLWISSSTATGVNFDELFVVTVVFSHVLDDTRPKDGMQGFIAVNLIGKSIKEAIAYNQMNKSVLFLSVGLHYNPWGNLRLEGE